MIKYYLYEGDGGEIVDACDECARYCGGLRVYRVEDADLAIAPRLSRILGQRELESPRLGTVILHPSLLPLYRGSDAVRQVIAAGEQITGVTWFWATEDIDAGDIAEQQLVRIPAGVSPGRLYHSHLVPAGISAFRRLWDQIRAGYYRRVPQA